MSLFANLLSGGQKARKSQRKDIDKFTEIEALLAEKAESLKKNIDLELLNAKKNIRKNRRAALQALRRKKWYEKHLKHISCAVKAMKSAQEHIESFNEVNDTMTEVPEEEVATRDASASLVPSVNQEVEFDEDAVLAELEKSLDENDSEVKATDGSACCTTALSSTSPLHPSEMEEYEIEDALEYLRRWANEAL